MVQSIRFRIHPTLSVITAFVFATVILLSQGQISAYAVSQTFTVTSSDTSGPGTFAQAVLDANANPGHDNINFNIAGSGPQYINANFAVAITDPVTIDGTTQSGSQCRQNLNIVFNFIPTWNKGIYLNPGSEGSIIKGVVVQTADSNGGIYLSTNQITFQCNYFEMTPDGQQQIAVRGQGPGIYISGNDHVIGGDTFEKGNVFGDTIMRSGSSTSNVLLRYNTFGFNAQESQFLGEAGFGSIYGRSVGISDLTIEDSLLQTSLFSSAQGITLKRNSFCINRARTQYVCGPSSYVDFSETSDVTVGTSDTGDANYFAMPVMTEYGEGITNLEFLNNSIGVDVNGNSILSASGSMLHGSNMTISGNTFGSAGGVFNTGGHNLIITNNTFDRFVIGSRSGNSKTENVEITNNQFETTADVSLQMIYGYNDMDNILIQSNNITNTSNGRGIIAWGYNDFDSVVIDNNAIQTNGTAIELSTPAGSVPIVSNNNVSGGSLNGNWGIYISGPDGEIFFNTIHDAWHGVHIGGGQGSIHNNMLQNISDIGIFTYEGTTVNRNGFSNIGNIAVTIRKIGEWYKNSDFQPPVIRKVKATGGNTQITYDFLGRNGDFVFDVCDSPSGDLPAGWGEGSCEIYLGSDTRDGLIEGEEYRFTMTVPGTGYNPDNLSIQAHLIDESQTDQLGASTRISRPDIIRPNLRVQVSSNVSQIPHGEIESDTFHVYVCNDVNDSAVAVTSFVLQINNQSNINVDSMVFLPELSDSDDLGTFNGTTNTWTGTQGLFDGHCIVFELLGNVTGENGQAVDFDVEIATAESVDGTLGEADYGQREDYVEHLLINDLPDAALYGRLLTPSVHNVGDRLRYELDISNLGEGTLYTQNFSMYLLLPVGTTFNSIIDLNEDDELIPGDGVDPACTIIASDISQMGPPFDTLSGEIVVCFFTHKAVIEGSSLSTNSISTMDASADAMTLPGVSYPFELKVDINGIYDPDSTYLHGIVMAENDPGTMEIQQYLGSPEDPLLLNVDSNNIIHIAYDDTPLTVTINRCVNTPVIIHTSQACFEIHFSKPIWEPSFNIADIAISVENHVGVQSMAFSSPLSFLGSISSFVRNSATQWTVLVSGISVGQTITLSVNPGVVTDQLNYSNAQSGGDSTVTYLADAQQTTNASGSESGQNGQSSTSNSSTTINGTLAVTGIRNSWEMIWTLFLGGLVIISMTRKGKLVCREARSSSI